MPGELIKKPQQQFQEKKSVKDENDKVATALLTFVTSALKAKANHSPGHYSTLVDQLNTKLDDPNALGRWYTALASCAGLVQPEFDSLIAAIFSYNWRASVSTNESYSKFLTNLVTASGFFLQEALRVLVASFSMKPDDAKDVKVSKELKDEKKEIPNDKRVATIDEIHDCVHATLSRILKLVPSSASKLFPVLVKHFPHTVMSSAALQLYVKNLLRISEYAPVLRDKIVGTIIERMILIDVEIERSEEKEEEDDLIFSLESEEKAKRGKKLNKEFAEKLDCLMFLMFEYLNLTKNGPPSLRDEVFASLLRVFERCVLKTHKSRFTQFLIFFYANLKHEYADAFLQRLLEIAFDKSCTSVDRHSAACYLASFLASAAFLRHTSVIAAFEMLLRWCLSYVDLHKKACEEEESDHQVSAFEASNHSIFYYICQTVFYTFSHRQDHFLQMYETAPQTVKGYDFEKLIKSPLNPLRFIVDSVSHQFAKVTRRLDVADCYKIIEANSKLVSAEKGSKITSSLTISSAEQRVVSFQIEEYFPFEPYTLPQSKKFLDALYFNSYKEEEKFEREQERVVRRTASESSQASDPGSFPSTPTAASFSSPVPIAAARGQSHLGSGPSPFFSPGLSPGYGMLSPPPMSPMVLASSVHGRSSAMPPMSLDE